jgi:arginyl-tRNA synthetase
MFNPQILQRLLLPYILSRKQSYGLDKSLGLQDPLSETPVQKKVVVEFSSPNIASDFQSRHLRSTIIGAHIANLYASSGWDVTKLNYLGDWGKPIGLLGVGWEKFGVEESFEKDPVGHLHEVYNKINDLFTPELLAYKHARDEANKKAEDKDFADIESQGLFAERNAYFKRIEDAEPEATAFYKRVRDVSIENYTQLYARLNVTFDEYSGESQVSPDTMLEVESILKEKDILLENGGQSIIDMKRHGGRAGTVVIRNHTGTSSYFLRDLAAVLERSRKYSFDKMIYVVAADQHKEHFTRLFKVLELMGLSELASKLQHVPFSPGPQVSAHGDMLGGILERCKTAMQESLEKNPETSTALGEGEEVVAKTSTAALLAQEFSTRRATDHTFDITHMTSFEPGTGPDLLCWHATLRALLRTTPNTEDFEALKISGHSRQDSGLEMETKVVDEIKDGDQVDLLRLLIQYPDVTQSAYKALEPAAIMTYLVSMTGQLSRCLKEGQEGSSGASAQRTLYEATQDVLENGMSLLGIKPVGS